MNPQLIKEFRALVVPWSVAILAAILRPMGNFLVGIHMIEGGTFLDFLFGIVGFAFFLSLLTIAAFPIGTEFQHRTFSLLLSQPIARSVIWRHKLIAASLGMASAPMNSGAAACPAVTGPKHASRHATIAARKARA